MSRREKKYNQTSSLICIVASSTKLLVVRNFGFLQRPARCAKLTQSPNWGNLSIKNITFSFFYCSTQGNTFQLVECKETVFSDKCRKCLGYRIRSGISNFQNCLIISNLTMIFFNVLKKFMY